MAGSDIIVKPTYYAVIPANIRYCPNLKPNEKLLYGEITALSNTTGECWASNQYFAGLYGVASETISRWISNLKAENFIDVDVVRKVSGEVEKRVIKLTVPIDEKINTSRRKDQWGIDEKVKENNTSINTTSTNKREIYKEKDDRLTLGEFKNVRLTFKQLDSLKDKFADWEDRVERLSAYKASSGKRYKNDYATILVWARKEENVPEKEEKKGSIYDGFQGKK